MDRWRDCYLLMWQEKAYLCIICLLICLLAIIFLFLLIYLFLLRFVCFSHLFIFIFVYLLICYLSVYMFTYSFVYCLLVHMFIHFSLVYSFIYLSNCLQFYIDLITWPSQNQVSLWNIAVLSDAVTEYPLSFRTGKLNQFIGFASPRPPPSGSGPFGKTINSNDDICAFAFLLSPVNLFFKVLVPVLKSDTSNYQIWVAEVH